MITLNIHGEKIILMLEVPVIKFLIFMFQDIKIGLKIQKGENIATMRHCIKLKKYYAPTSLKHLLK